MSEGEGLLQTETLRTRYWRGGCRVRHMHFDPDSSYRHAHSFQGSTQTVLNQTRWSQYIEVREIVIIVSARQQRERKEEQPSRPIDRDR
jgi:hypothetical protein